MYLPQEIVDRIFSHLLRLSFNNLMVYATYNRVWYLAARKAFYRRLDITNSVRVDRLLGCLEGSEIRFLLLEVQIFNRSITTTPPIAEKPNCYRLLRACVNLQRLEAFHINPFYILKCFLRANLSQLEEIRMHWPTMNHSTEVKKLFCAANYAHRATIKTLEMPSRDFSEY